MLLIYGVCFIVGGVFVLLSALGGLDGVDFATDFDADFEGSFDDIDVGTHAGQKTLYQRLGRWLPFLSLRFWTFAACFFGLTGLLISWVQPDLAPWLVTLVAVLMGWLCGMVAVLVLRSLGSNQVNSLTRPEDLAGQVGTVEIPFDAHSRGKVRLRLGGSTVAFFAFTEEERTLQAGEPVLVVGLEHNKLWVVSSDVLPPQDVEGGK